MSRLARWMVLSAALSSFAAAATLQQLSLAELTEKSTAIVTGRAGGERVVQEGALLYTLQSFSVSGQWKGEATAKLEIALPGGRLGDLQQRFGGVPQLEPGREYLIFLWQGPSGRTQITGLSQGLLEIVREDGGEPLVVRKPSADVVLIPAAGEGAAAEDGIHAPLSQIVAAIERALAAGRSAAP